MSKPLLVTDCDEVLLHMVVPFGEWLAEKKDIDFDLTTGDFANALRHKHDGTNVEPAKIWPLLQAFFDTEMHRQKAIDHAVDTVNEISKTADVVILTNLLDNRREARAAQLKAVGLDFPVVCNQGGKGDPFVKIIAEYNPSVALFVDDLGNHHESVGSMAPETWRLHMVGEPILAPHIKPARHAHNRIDNWKDALPWIMNCFEQGGAPEIGA